jgi:hypothetical protein
MVGVRFGSTKFRDLRENIAVFRFNEVCSHLALLTEILVISVDIRVPTDRGSNNTYALVQDVSMCLVMKGGRERTSSF